jgi:hypothetical protein
VKTYTRSDGFSALGAFTPAAGLCLTQPALWTKPEERAKALEILLSGDRRVGPTGAEIPDRVDIELLEWTILLHVAPGQKALLK